jgi:hypothetical protein
MKMSSLKSEVMAFKRQVPTRNKTVIHNILLEEVNIFTYLGYKTPHERKRGKPLFVQILRIMNNVLKPNSVHR